MIVPRQLAACAAKALGLALLLPCNLPAQLTADATQQLVFAGLRTSAAKGQFTAVTSDSAGDVYLLYDQGDGVRILKITNDGIAVLAETLMGAAGDSGVAMTLDAAGDLYVAGVSGSGGLAATPGAAIPQSTSAFLAKFDSGLNEMFLTFTGGTRIAPTAIVANGDAVFLAGNTYAGDLPVTSGSLQQVPAAGSTQNGFVERFTVDGATVSYATYVSAAGGDTTPTGIAVDAAGDVWLVGSTSSAAFPTMSAVVPVMLSDPSGFLLELTPAGDALTFSTFIPGDGLNAVSLDSLGTSLLLSGNVALGQFPVDTVTAPLIPGRYQVLLRMSLDGSSVASGTVIAPGASSSLVAAQDGAAWIAGEFDPDLPPLLQQAPIADVGTGYAARITPSLGIDQTLRFGGLANGNQTYAHLYLGPDTLTVDPAGELLVAGAVQPSASASLLATQTYDLSLMATPTAALPSLLSDAQVTPALCTESACTGSAGYLAKVNPASALPALAFSTGDAPFIVLRNLGSASADDLQLATSTGTYNADCPTSLPPGAECHLLLSGGIPGQVIATASNAGTHSAPYSSYSAPSSTLAFSPKELDFGVQTSTSTAATRTITITNLGSSTQTFASGVPALPGLPSPYYEAASSCPLASSTSKSLAAGASCTLTVGFAAFSDPGSDGSQTADWSIGARQVLLTGYSQAASLSLSSEEVDFGTQVSGGLKLPRFLYLSNASTNSVPHASVALPASSPFTVTDLCPSTLAPASVCRLRIDYDSPVAPSSDSVSLELDQGLAVLITGTTIASASSPTTSGLTGSPTSVTFHSPVVVTSVSSEVQTVSISNPGSAASTLAMAVSGDFAANSSCGTTLAAGATCAVALQFVPSQPGTRQGALTISGQGGTVTVPITATATGVFPSQDDTLAFPGTPVYQPIVQFYKVSQPFDTLNASTAAPFRLTLVEDTGSGPGQPPATAYVTSITSPCHNCWLALRFEPDSVGAQSGTLILSSNPAGHPFQLLLTGSGIAITGLAASPSVADFGAIPVGSSSGATLFTITNLTSGAVSIDSPHLTGDFAVSSSNCASSLAAGASCSVSVVFAPTVTGARAGSLTLESTASTASASLLGTGTPANSISVAPSALTFTPSSSTQTVVLTNIGSAVAIGAPSTTSPHFTTTSNCGNLLAGASCSIQVSYIPAATQISGTLKIPVISTGSNGQSVTTFQSVALTADYTASTAALTIQPSSASYGAIATGLQGPAQQFTIANQSLQALALSTNMPRQYVLMGDPCVAIAVNSTCSFAVAFDPLTNGDVTGSIVVHGMSADASVESSVIAYTDGFGVGTGTLDIRGGLIVNGSYDFGQVASGQTAQHTFTLANDGVGGSPAISIRRVTSEPPFLSTTTCIASLTPGSLCTVTVTYAALNHALGNSNDMGTLIIESDAQSSPDAINLTGNASPSSATGTTPLATYTLTQGSLAFAATGVGELSAPQTTVLTNTGTVPVQIASLTTTSDFAVQSSCTLVAPGAFCPITVASTPQTIGQHLAALEISSNSASALDFVSLAGAGVASPLTLAPAALSFGSVPVGMSSALPVTVTNSSNFAITFLEVSTTGNYTLGGNCPVPGSSLAALASCTLEITFAPLTTGTLTGQLSVATSASTLPLTASLTGVGTLGNLVVSPGSLAFGSVAVGASASLMLMLTNNGTAPVTALSLNTTADYAVTTPCAQTALAPGSTCNLGITFSPTVASTDNGTLTITTASPSTLPDVVPLTGSGYTISTGPLPPPGTFSLTINGQTTAPVSVATGGSVSAALTATPIDEFTGGVALTCAPLQAVSFAVCTVVPSQVDLTSGVQSATVTISTGSNTARANPNPAPRIFLVGIISLCIIQRRRRFSLALSLAIVLTGCGNKYTVVKTDATTTPPGSYVFEITGASVADPATTRAVLLTLTVTSN